MNKTQAAKKIKFDNSVKSQFFTTLKKRVDNHFQENNKSPYANTTMVLKTVVLISAYLLPFFAILIMQPPIIVSIILWLIMGIAISGIGMSIMHDANHGAYSKFPGLNKWMGRTIHFAGVGVTNWKLQHNILHHTYTNVVPMDEDIRDRGVVKLSPHAEPKAIHRFQWLYAFFFYGILTLYWFILKDFIQYIGFIKSGVNRQSSTQNRRMLANLILVKTIYLGIFFVIPVFVFHLPFIEILTGFLVMHFTSGLLLTVIFQLAHSVEGTSHPQADNNGLIHNNWAIHQLETTVNFAPNNKWLSWYIGGLNFQIEHHLFPKICHVHYPSIAPIVKQTAQEFGITYQENPTFMSAFRSHIISLKRFGKLPDPNDAIG
jgi:linoleoyl-CoA desaturase